MQFFVGVKRINFNFFKIARTQNLCRKLIKFYNYIPQNMEMCMGFFQGYTEIQNGCPA